jgi:hypothetical protein
MRSVIESEEVTPVETGADSIGAAISITDPSKTGIHAEGNPTIVRGLVPDVGHTVFEIAAVTARIPAEYS